MRGEPLRDRTPSVSSLLDRRARELLTREGGLEAATALALALARWEPAASLPVARDVSRRWEAEVARGEGFQTSIGGLRIAELTLARVAAQDGGALAEYAAFMRRVTPALLDSYVADALAPLRARPDDPALAALGTHLFGDDRSPWVPRIGVPDGGPETYHLMRFLDGEALAEMVRIAAFRGMLVRRLDDTRRVGRARREDNGVRIELADGSSSWYGVSEPRPPGDWQEIRACDYVAARVSTLPGAPAFGLDRPLAERDAARRALRHHLRTLH
jgi:hypothetical protein